METSELIEIIARDEDSRHQFKADLTNEVSAGQEMVAFSNTKGGMLIIGVSNDGQISGLNRDDMNRLNNLISNAASQQVKPAINPITENIQLPEGLVMVVHIPQGISKPYMDKNGVIWVKSGADKRKATSREEIQRIYQSAGLIHGDEILVPNMLITDMELDYFKSYFLKRFNKNIDDIELPLKTIISNLNLGRDGFLNIAGALLFGKNNSFKLPSFIVKCVAYPSNVISVKEYRDSEDISGIIENVYRMILSFITRNLQKVQKIQSINSIGELEIPKVVFEELIANALIHRDYFISAPIRIFIFSDRIEIISPGHLPNNLTIENIKNGNSNQRNPILTSHATHILPYRGLGTGIIRAVTAYKDISFIDDRDSNIFKVVIMRPNKS